MKEEKREIQAPPNKQLIMDIGKTKYTVNLHFKQGTGETFPNWDLTGGGMDFGETIELSLKRELLEEVGYKGDLRHQLFDVS